MNFRVHTLQSIYNVYGTEFIAILWVMLFGRIKIASAGVENSIH